MKFENNEDLWNLMGENPVPEPSGEMQADFNAMLEDYKTSAGAATKPVAGQWAAGQSVMAGLAGLWRLFRGQPWLVAAFSFILLAGGFGLGYFVRRPGAPVVITKMVQPAVAQTSPTNAPIAATQTAPQSTVVQSPTSVQTTTHASPETADRQPTTGERQQLEALTAQVHEMREMMMMALLQNPSASERMRAVSYTDGIKHVNANMTEALLATLNTDPNVNVRLTTLDALSHFAGNPAVREGLVQSILQQDSPLVQAALADVMLKLQERRAVKAFKKLLQQKDLNSTVRTKIEQTITRLI